MSGGEQDAAASPTTRVHGRLSSGSGSTPETLRIDDYSRFRGLASIAGLNRQLGAMHRGLGAGPRYVLGDLVGEGGQGLVLRLFDADCRRTVALKVLRKRDASERQIARFVHEAQITAQLAHPAIVAVHDLLVLEDGTIGYVMKLIEGETLLEHSRERAGKAEHRYDLLQILLKACDAVAFAHSRGVIHRDLKPLNIMVGAYGEVLVLDWGLSKVVGASEVTTDRHQEIVDSGSASPFQTHDGATVGTLGYMSPEQARGDNEIVDARSDIFALGVVLYELLCGRTPYPDPDSQHDRLDLVTRGAWVPLHAQATPGGLPPSLTAVAERAMAYEPEQRYQSVGEFAADLRRFLAGQAVSAYRESRLEVLRRWARHNRGAVRAGVLVGSLGLIALMLWWTVAALERNRRRGELLHGVETALASDRHDAALAGIDRLLELSPGDTGLALRRGDIERERDSARAAQRLAEQRAQAAAGLARARELAADAAPESLHQALELCTQVLGLLPPGDDRSAVLALRDELRRDLDRSEAQRYVAEGLQLAAARNWSEAQGRLRLAVERGHGGVAVERLRELLAAGQAEEARAELVRRAQAEWDAAREAAAQGDLDAATERMRASLRLAVLDGADDALLGWDAQRNERNAALAAAQEAALRQQQVVQAIATGREAIARGELAVAVVALARGRDLDRDDPGLAALEQELAAATAQRAEVLVAEAMQVQGTARTAASALRSAARELSELSLTASYASDAATRAAASARREELRRQIDAARGSRAASLALAQEQLTAARELAPAHPPVLRALARFYAERVLEADTGGDAPAAAVYASLGRAADPDKSLHAVFAGLAAVRVPAGAQALRLEPLDTGGEAVLVAPGAAVDVAAGRYRLLGAAGTSAAQRFHRGQEYAVDLPPPPTDLPSELAWIPPGSVLDAEGAVVAAVDSGFALARREVTCGAWLEFLNAPATQRRLRELEAAGVARLHPRRDWARPEPLWNRHRLGSYGLELVDGSRAAIDPATPVSWISRLDIVDYLAWRRERDGLAWRLPSDEEWRLAAQSGDGRPWSWGEYFDPGACFGAALAPRTETLIAPPAANLRDVSEHGVHGLAGGVAEHVERRLPLDRVWLVRGGCWRDLDPDRFASHAGNGLDERLTAPGVGFRLAVSVSGGRLERVGR